jgi:hypothetical protein
MNVRIARAIPLVFVLGAATLGCGEEELLYVAKPAVSGRKASLPSVPTLPQKAKKVGDAYTIWGASHDLRSRVHVEDVLGKKIAMIGYIVKTNYETAPPCAVHKTGKADPADCKPEPPTFYIADEKGELKDVVPVMGWASNFAQLFSMIEAIDNAPKGK